MFSSVGGSFQWPPPKEDEDQGATATPLYMDPKGENLPHTPMAQQQQPRPAMMQPQSNPAQQQPQQQMRSDWDATLNANKARNWMIAI